MGAAWQPASRALLLGNFAIGCGVLVVPGSLNDLSRGLAVSPAVAGQLLAAFLGGFDRRRGRPVLAPGTAGRA